MTNFRDAPDEQLRIGSLMQLLPPGKSILEIGARDGYISRLLAQRYEEVHALDLSKPEIDAPNVICVKGDIRGLEFEDNRFDVVICTEVLEHIPAVDLPTACRELARVVRQRILIGVPSEQDLRAGRTRCANCGAINPPYGHVNRFDRTRLASLFEGLNLMAIEGVGSTRRGTNWMSDLLMRAAGYPWGTYDQDEPCIRCDSPVGPAPRRTIASRVLSRAAININRPLVQRRKPGPKWLHCVFAKRQAPSATP